MADINSASLGRWLRLVSEHSRDYASCSAAGQTPSSSFPAGYGPPEHAAQPRLAVYVVAALCYEWCRGVASSGTGLADAPPGGDDVGARNRVGADDPPPVEPEHAELCKLALDTLAVLSTNNPDIVSHWCKWLIVGGK